MTRLEEDCCATCPCGTVVHLGGVHPVNSCEHGLAVCEDCRPGRCDECADDVAEEVAA